MGTENKRRGAFMSTKQLARTAITGNLLQIHIGDGTTISGYLCGLDDFHYKIVSPEGTMHLVHKSAPHITIGEDGSFEREPERDVLEPLVTSFREWAQEAGHIPSSGGRSHHDAAKLRDESEHDLAPDLPSR